MFARRAVDPVEATHYRSMRISSVNGEYFFSTREGTFEGPFSTKIDAEQEIALYIRHSRMTDHIANNRR